VRRDFEPAVMSSLQGQTNYALLYSDYRYRYCMI
jgi:hypothetical protein